MSTEITTKEPEGQFCLNCRTILENERYCPTCGQENTSRNISFLTLIQDFLGDYFSFDSKFFSTLLPLFSRPGKVPKEFIDGHRVKHIPPLRMLIFSSFIFFFVWGLTFDPGIEGRETIMESIEREKQEAIARGDSTVVMDSGMVQFNFDGIDTVDSKGVDFKLEEILKLAEGGVPLEKAVDSIAVDNSDFEKRLYTQMAKVGLQNKSTVAKYFVGNLSLTLLIVQPFFAFLLKLLYIRGRKKHRFIGHLVFSLYFHGWLMIIATVALLIQKVFPSLTIMPLITLPAMIYMTIAIKKFYEQSWGKTIIKSLAIVLFYIGILLPLFITLSFGTSFYFF